VDLRQLPEYLAGRRTSFDLPLDLMGTPFQRRCWQALIEIPFGETRTYSELARGIGMAPGAARAVGQANGANPVPVIVPCHRVVASAGLGGYAGGLELKRRLLELEGVFVHSL
jgi:methylated-DNA-[protein]-cysteine S-methyltransferase